MSRTTTTAMFLLLAALWGSSFTAIRVGLPDVPPVLFAALRFYLAGGAMLAYAATADRWRPVTRVEWTEVVVGGPCSSRPTTPCCSSVSSTSPAR